MEEKTRILHDKNNSRRRFLRQPLLGNLGTDPKADEIRNEALLLLALFLNLADDDSADDPRQQRCVDGKHHPRRFEVDETELIADTMKKIAK